MPEVLVALVSDIGSSFLCGYLLIAATDFTLSHYCCLRNSFCKLISLTAMRLNIHNLFNMAKL